MRKGKPMIFLRWRKVKAVAAEQTSVGRNLRSISEQGPSNLAEQTKRWPPWVIFHKKEVGGGPSGGRRRGARWRESLIDSLSVAPSNGDASVAIASIISLRFSTTVYAAPRRSIQSRCHRIVLHRIESLPPSSDFSKILNSIPQFILMRNLRPSSSYRKCEIVTGGEFHCN